MKPYFKINVYFYMVKNYLKIRQKIHILYINKRKEIKKNIIKKVFYAINGN